MANNKEDFTSHGFTTVSAEVTPRLIMALSGLEKTGKTYHALTAPAPIAYFSLDFGEDGVIQPFAAKKAILRKDYKMPAIRKSNDRAKAMEQATEVWESFKDDYLFALDNCRTVIVDTETEVYELIRLARFGKLEQVKPHHYGPLFRELKEVIIKAAYESNCNVILLQRLKKEFKDDKWSGQYEVSGYSGIPYDVQVNCRTYIDGRGRFRLYIDNCRQNATLRGKSLLDFNQMVEADGADPSVQLVDGLRFSELAKLVLPTADGSKFE
jgi:hypothetical protein